MSTYIVDIDGTISDTSHREWALRSLPGEKPDWEMFFKMMGEDTPIPHMQQLLQDLDISTNKIIYASGRPERYRKVTEWWLAKHGFPRISRLYMRKDNDHRPDNIVKKEILDEMRLDGYIPTMAFDDRNQVVEMWRHNGIPCAQVAEGNF